jgi:O-antigen/teichoic acid export membrane protein
VLLNRGDILALGTTVSAHELAPSTAASRYAALRVLGLAAASAVGAAVMRDYWRQNDRENLQHAIDRSAGVAAIFALPLALVFIIMPQPLLRLYGPGYVAGDTALRLLALGQLINALTGPVSLIVIVCDLTRAYAIVMGGAVLLLMGLLVVLIPPFGLVGAASAALLALITLNLGLALLIKRRLGLRSWATPGAIAAALRDLANLRRITTEKAS